MPAAASRVRTSLFALVGSAVALTGLQVVSMPAALANPAGTGLVINEFYGGGGNSGALYSNDFVELFNPTDQPISVDGWSVQYTSASGTSITASGASQGWTALSGSVPAHGYYLVQEAPGTTVTDKPLPTADATGVIPMGAAGGKLFLVNSTTLLSGSQLAAGPVTPGQGIFASVVDMVGGNTPNQYEGAKVTSNPANATSMSRNAAHADTDNNLADFPTPYAAPTPKNSSNVDSGESLPSVNPITAKSWTTNTAISDITPSASGGTPPYSFAVTGLPAGISFTAGKITGTPTAAGTGTATVTVTDNAAKQASTTFTWTVGQPPSAGPHVLISEVWGDGGFTGAAYKNSYVELYNPTDAAVNLSGYSLGYVAASNQTPPVVGSTLRSNLTGSIPAKGYYLISGFADAAGNGAALPTPDATSAIKWHYADGTIALLDTQAAVDLDGGDLTGKAHVVDALGYGPSGAYHAVAYEGAESGFATGLGIAAYRDPVDVDTNNNAVDFKAGDLSPTNSAGLTGNPGGAPLPTTCAAGFPSTASISQIQGDTGVAAGINCTVTTTGVVTAVYTKGFKYDGTATCGSCGFYIQDPNGNPGDGSSDAVFVYAGTKFDGKTFVGTGDAVNIGDSVQVTGKVSEFGGGETLTEVNAFSDTAGAITKLGTSLGTITPQPTVPTTYAGREAHEGELFAPTDVVVTDTFNFETLGELGLASGDKPLQQPGQVCRDGDTACITAAQTDVKDRGYFLTGGTTYLNSYSGENNYYTPNKAANSDIPLPFVDKTHSARVGAKVTFPRGAVLDVRNKKWYLNPPRSVVAAGHDAATPDLGQDVVTFEDTRPGNDKPAEVGGDLRFATYNVENFFSIPATDFAAANPYYKCSFRDDRAGNHVTINECTSPSGIATAWDDVTGTATAYKSGVVSAPRGAARQADLDRQTEKIVTAVNKLGADVVALEELGNPNKLKLGVTNGPLSPDANKADGGQGTAIAWRDATVDYLVKHLNAAAGSEVWAYASSPEESMDATSVPGLCSKVQPNGQPVPGPAHLAGTCSWASGQDVIRSAFIYKKASIVPVGAADLDLPGSSAPVPSPFDNAREPFAQYFKPVGAPNSAGFALIVNHFKSKGDSDPAAIGADANDPLHGAFNASRVAQAKELVRFANEFAGKWKTDKVFLLGDFNAYSGEDPVHAILDDPSDALDFEEIHSDDPKDTSYVFTTTVDGIGYGGAGSLDHIFASAGARSLNPHTDIWEINANEPGVYNYGRYNTNRTDFWDGATPFGGSDHNPEVVGLDLPDAGHVKDVQLIGSNDFHGRLIGSSSDGGAAQLTSGVKHLKSTYGEDNSIFVAAGDLIGASTFESFVQHDKPTLEALNKAGLEVSAVGNHEFDQGYEDLINRVMQPESAANPYGAEGGLQWDYIGSNVVYAADPDGDGEKKAGDPIVMPTATKTVGGVKIGFVGAVTEDLLGLVSPAGMQNIAVLPIAQTVNHYADKLKSEDGVDLVVLLLHEGSPTTDCSKMQGDGSNFATVLNNLDDNVDTVISGHTHLEYSCQFAVDGWSGRPVSKRPVVSAGQYGMALDQVVYSFDADNKPVDVVVNNVGVKGPGGALFAFDEDPEVKAVVDEAIAAAEGPGNTVLGKIAGRFDRAKLGDGVTENRGGESTLGNLVAEIQRWATPTTEGIAPAQIAFMNPGGLRADLVGKGATFPKDVTYKEAAGVQPFANTLVNVDMTGAQIRTVLEQQWQRDDKGNVPSRPFLRLGTSAGFTYTYSETADAAHPGAKLGHVTGMWLNGTPIADTDTFSVTMNSFLASGGDNFRAFTQGADKRDTGKTDLQAQVEYMAAKADTVPLAPDYAQHAVSVTFPDNAPSAYAPGDHVRFTLGSLDMTGTDDKVDDTLTVKLGSADLGTVSVTHTAGSTPNDERGTASVDVVLPTGIAGPQRLTVVGATTGTRVVVPISLPKVDSAVHAEPQTATYGASGALGVTVTGTATPTGTVAFTEGDTALGTAPVGADGVATLAFDTVTLAAGEHTVTATYSGDSGLNGSTTSFTVAVAKGSPTVNVGSVSAVAGEHVDVPVSVTAGSAQGTGTVRISDGVNDLGSGELTDGLVVVDVDSSSLSVGEHTLTATYEGSANLLEASAPFTLTVGLAPASVTGSDVTATYGSALTLSATVTPASAGGTVTFSEGSTQLGTANVGQGGVATLTYVGDALAVGTHQVTVAYSGDATHASATDELTVTVTKAASEVTAGAASVKVGENGSLTVTVKGPEGLDRPTGTVTVKNGGTTIGQGQLANGTATVTVDTAALAVGAYTLTLGYAGDDNYLASTGTVQLTVAKAVPTVSVSSATQVFGATTSVEVKVTGPKTPTGTVTLGYGSTVLGTGTLSGAKVTITVPAGALAPGTYTLTATYSGDGSNEGAQSGAGQLTVTPAPASAVKASAPVIPAAGRKAVAVHLSVNGLLVNGRVTLKVGQRTVTVTAVNGVAKVKRAQLKRLLGNKKKAKVTVSGTGFSTKLTLKVKRR